MNLDIQLPSPITKINKPLLLHSRNIDGLDNVRNLYDLDCPDSYNNISIVCKRDDLIHSIISGNKWRKLSASLATVIECQHKHVISFGGAYSNHLHALSYACAVLKIKFTAIIRGNYSKQLTPTLTDMQQWGTHLHFVSKIEYKQKTDATYCQSLLDSLAGDFLIPEGGSHAQYISGVGAILSEIEVQAPTITHIVLPVASAGTLAGLLSSKALPQAKLVGIGVLKGKGYLEDLVKGLLGPGQMDQLNKEWEILHDYHHGGYAKTSAQLTQFVNEFNQYYSGLADSTDSTDSADNAEHERLAIEPIYSGKCFFALKHLLNTGYFPANSKILVLHTGGLQGARASSLKGL